MRLIDADELMMCLRCNVLIDVTPELENEVENQPTAFDKETVMNKLTELREAECDDSAEEPELIDGEDIYDEGRSQGRFEAYHKAIKIVEKGGVD